MSDCIQFKYTRSNRMNSTDEMVELAIKEMLGIQQASEANLLVSVFLSTEDTLRDSNSVKVHHLGWAPAVPLDDYLGEAATVETGFKGVIGLGTLLESASDDGGSAACQQNFETLPATIDEGDPSAVLDVSEKSPNISIADVSLQMAWEILVKRFPNQETSALHILAEHAVAKPIDPTLNQGGMRRELGRRITQLWCLNVRSAGRSCSSKDGPRMIVKAILNSKQNLHRSMNC